jgi:hypothetical protein
MNDESITGRGGSSATKKRSVFSPGDAQTALLVILILASSCTTKGVSTRPSVAPLANHTQSSSPSPELGSPTPTSPTILSRLLTDDGVVTGNKYPRLDKWNGPRRGAYKSGFDLCSLLGLRNMTKQLHTDGTVEGTASAFIQAFPKTLWKPAYKGCVDGLGWTKR